MESNYDQVLPLDLNDPAHIEIYERSFYKAFAPLTHNRLIHSLWLWDHDNQRLSTRIGYDQQIILVHWCDSGAIDSAFAVNLLGSGLQSAYFGFAVPEQELPHKQNNCCEFLTLFSLANKNIGSLPLRYLKAAFAQLRQRGLQHGYATTARKLLPYYLRMGGKIIETKMIEGEERIFLEFELD